MPAYAAAKGALGQLTKALSNEWSKDNVQVNGICPGYIATDMCVLPLPLLFSFLLCFLPLCFSLLLLSLSFFLCLLSSDGLCFGLSSLGFFALALTFSLSLSLNAELECELGGVDLHSPVQCTFVASGSEFKPFS